MGSWRQMAGKVILVTSFGVGAALAAMLARM